MVAGGTTGAELPAAARAAPAEGASKTPQLWSGSHQLSVGIWCPADTVSLEISPRQPRASQPPPAPPSLTGTAERRNCKNHAEMGYRGRAELRSERGRSYCLVSTEMASEQISAEMGCSGSPESRLCRSAPRFSTGLCSSDFHFVFKTRTLKMLIKRSEAHRAELCMDQVGFICFSSASLSGVRGWGGTVHTRKRAREEPSCLLLQGQGRALPSQWAKQKSSLGSCPNAQCLFCVCLFNYRTSPSDGQYIFNL